MQRALRLVAPTIGHLAIVMDGNGRWATQRGLPRPAGHAAGARAVKRVVEAAARRGVGTLTVYAFSGDNWRRPASEVEALLRLFARYLEQETARCVRNGIRLEVIGRRDRLPAPLCAAAERAERRTSAGTTMTLRVALDYSGRDAIAAAAARVHAARAADAADESGDRDAFREALAAVMHASSAPDVDLLIRTGGEQRLSDFMLWECAYAELYFTPVLWPDFSADDLDAALAEFARRERRFGGLPDAAAPDVPATPRVASARALPE